MIKRFAGWTGIVVLVCLGVVATTGKARLIRPDILAAIACTPRLFGDGAVDGTFLLPYRDTIQAEAQAADLPPEILAVVIIGHQFYQTPARDYTDCAGSALGANLSLGLAQVRMSTAAETGGEYLPDISHSNFHRLRRELLAPASNIRYAARELRELLDRYNRYPGISAQALIQDPYKVALLLSEYRAGWSPISRLSANAISDMRFFLFDAVYLFDREPVEARGIQDRIREYLGSVYCDNTIFNSQTCTAWQEGALMPQLPPPSA